MLTALVLCALAAGVTGAWSPCGFSMVETLAPSGWARGRAGTALACATFTLGALAGGALTFGALALAGSLLGAGGPVAAAAAAAVAVAAALGEARGARILPQVRRQVPEAWRRVLPLPLAAGGYGVLLGLGFTTFVLSFAVWALAAVALLLGDPLTGVAIGLAFGAGRMLPVVALAPLADRPAGIGAHAAMAERPGILRGLRAVDAIALVAVALLVSSAEARAAAADPAAGAGRAGSSAQTGATVVGFPASDPSATGTALAWHEPGSPGLLDRGGERLRLPGPDPAVGAGFVAFRQDGAIVVARRDTLETLRVVPAAGADKLAIGAYWLAWREPAGDGDRLVVQDLRGADAPRVVARVPAPVQLSRPALDGDRLVFHVAGTARSEIREVDLPSGRRRVLRRARDAALTNPSVAGGRLLYVRTGRRRQELVLGRRLARRSDRVLYRLRAPGSRDAGKEPGGSAHSDYPPARRASRTLLWTTALAPEAAYVVRLRGARPTLLKIAR